MASWTARYQHYHPSPPALWSPCPSPRLLANWDRAAGTECAVSRNKISEPCITPQLAGHRVGPSATRPRGATVCRSVRECSEGYSCLLILISFLCARHPQPYCHTHIHICLLPHTHTHMPCRFLGTRMFFGRHCHRSVKRS